MEILAKLKYSLCLTLTVLMLLVSAQAQSEARITFYHHDNLGSPIAASDRDGNVLWRETYAPFGQKTVNDSAAEEERVGYTGKLHDNDTGLTYLNARYYDPVVGRFMAMDPVGPLEGGLDHFNRYAYAYNNPLKYIDPTGEWGLCGSCGDSPEGFDPERDAAQIGTLNDLGYSDGERFSAKEIMSLDDVPGYAKTEEFSWKRLLGAVFGVTCHGNCLASTRPNHVYEIYDVLTNKTYKYGVSGVGLTEEGLSKRAEAQVNKLNKKAGYKKYASKLKTRNNLTRREAVRKELALTTRYAVKNQKMPPGMKRPVVRFSFINRR
ncbi:RHS repeat-associated core domain-containing protein [Hahella ganghwensis]|uniref:RHS repeat-associated core domain-containing protein n=1 Tax=Hahella ganghwensis TaxID=286420 RepID=UPI00036091C8|nr:RHS repeat-associated core domain-containing protein [Hahella ganghwensis]